MKQPYLLKNLLIKYRLTIVDVVLLSVLESVLFVAQFYFIGKAVNDLLKDSWDGVYILIALFISKVLVSYIKQNRIGKTYKRIYDLLIMKTIAGPLEEGEEIKTLAPKSSIIYELTSFFKGDLIRGFESIVRLILVLLALFFLYQQIFWMAIGMSTIVFCLYLFKKKKTLHLSSALAGEIFNEHDVLQSGNSESLVEHHRKLERIDNDLLGVSATNLSIIEILSFAFMIVSIILLVKTEGENAFGTFLTLMYYIMAFSEIMFLLPSKYQKYLRTQALSKML